MPYIFILLFTLLTFPPAAYAKKSDLLQSCHEKYTLTAASELAAEYISQSCLHLYGPYSFNDYLNENSPYIKIATDGEDATFNALRKLDQQWIKITPDAYEKYQSLFFKHKISRKRTARCILSNKELLKAKTEIAARIILQNMDCWDTPN